MSVLFSVSSAAVKLWRKKTEVRTELKKDRDPESKIKSCYHKCFCVHAVRAYPLSYAEPAQPHGEAMDQERPLITRLSPPRSDNTQQPLQSFQCRRPARKASSARPVVGDIYLTRRFRDVMGWSARLANPGTRDHDAIPSRLVTLLGVEFIQQAQPTWTSSAATPTRHRSARGGSDPLPVDPWPVTYSLERYDSCARGKRVMAISSLPIE